MKTTLALLFTLLTLPILALDDTKANREQEATRYVNAIPPKEIVEDLFDQVAKDMGLVQRDDLKARFFKNFDIEAMTKAMTAAMIKNFTADELKALADFHGSPVGKSAMKKMGAYLEDVTPLLKAEVVKGRAKSGLEATSEVPMKRSAPPVTHYDPVADTTTITDGDFTYQCKGNFTNGVWSIKDIATHTNRVWKIVEATK